MALFKRKVGGTVVGNLLRTGVNLATKGLLGNGALMLKDFKLSPDQQTEKLKQTANGVGAAVEAYQAQTGGESPVTSSFKNGAVAQWLKLYWWVLALPVVSYVIYKQLKRR